MRDQQRLWEEIAASFDRTRTRPWPHVAAFLRALPPASRILDLMGGNGRHLPAALDAGHDAVWTDFSRPAARIVAARYPKAHAVAADARHLPFATASFDACVFVAGLHAVLDTQARATCLAELHRVLRPGAPAQVTVWSRDATRFRDLGEPGQPLDVVLPWRSDGHDAQRHTFLYTPTALRHDLETAGFTIVSLEPVTVVTEADNLVALVRKA